MAKILIVDDEKLTRADILYKVSRSGFTFDWIMEAASAEEALGVIRENQPDILLTDIIMNEINGIELIRAARKIRPEMAAIIICGYPDFTYAQEAVRLNVVDYLLKPVRQEQLTAVLSKALYAVKREKEYLSLSAKSDMLKKQLNDRELWERLHIFLNSAEGFGSRFDKSSIFPDDAENFLVCILRVSLPDRAGRFRANDYDLLRYGIANIVLELGKGYFLPFNSFGERHQVIVIAASPTRDTGIAWEKLRQTARRFLRAASEGLHVHIDMGMSTAGTGLSAMQMVQAKQALDMRLYGEPGNEEWRGFYYGDISGAALDMPEEDFRLYRNFISGGDLRGALETARRIFESPALSNIRMAYIEMNCILVRACARKGVSIYSYLGSECVNGSIIDRFETKRDVVESLCNTITQALSQWVEAADTKAVLQNVKGYIEGHFCDNTLCTNSLSSRFSISLGYLSASYKKVFGTPISKYIISLRMQYAGRLLRETTYSLQTICEQTGFNNLSYFLRVFKRTHGCTPTEYRERVLPEGVGEADKSTPLLD